MSKNFTAIGDVFCEYQIYVCVHSASIYSWAQLQEARGTIDTDVSGISVSEQ